MATLESRLASLITAIGTDWKNIWAKIGAGSLNTTATNLIAAINEVKTTADSAVAGTTPDASETVKGKIELATNAESITGTDNVRAVHPQGLKAVIDARVVAASTSAAGIMETATDAEALAYSATTVALTPSNLAAIRGVANGVATLDGSGLVPTAQLPGFVDDVLEFANLAGFPGTGTTGKMYVAIDTGKVYRWTGSVYVEISASPGTTDAVPEGSTNLYYTQTRVDARIDAKVTTIFGNPDADLVTAYTTAKA